MMISPNIWFYPLNNSLNSSVRLLFSTVVSCRFLNERNQEVLVRLFFFNFNFFLNIWNSFG